MKSFPCISVYSVVKTATRRVAYVCLMLMESFTTKSTKLPVFSSVDLRARVRFNFVEFAQKSGVRIQESGVGHQGFMSPFSEN